MQIPSKKSRQEIRYSFIEIMTGSDLSRRRLAMMQASSPKSGPVVWLTACGHGDEVGGVVVIQEVFRMIRKYPLLQGRLNAFPLMNPLGLDLITRNITMSGEDLNRAFPGNRNGSLAQRIAFKIFNRITKSPPALVVDLHNDWRGSIPYTVLDPDPGPPNEEAYAKTREFAKMAGFALIRETEGAGEEKLSRRTLSGSLLHHGIPAITLELGEAFVVNERNISYGVRSLWTILSSLGMVGPIGEPFRYPLPEEAMDRELRYSQEPLSTTSGIIRFLSKAGDLVKPGQAVARIYNAFGRNLETIAARERALVLGHSDSSVAFPGVPVMAFGVFPDDPPSVMNQPS